MATKQKTEAPTNQFKNGYVPTKKEDLKRLIKRFVHVARITDRIREANNQSDIGYMYHKLVYHTVMDDGLKMISEIDIDGVYGLLAHIDWVFDEYGLTRDNLEWATDDINNHIMVHESWNNQGSFLFARCGRSRLSNYLKNCCSDIEDKELFHYDKETDKILVCNDRWLMAHFEFLLKTIKKLEALKLRIESGGNEERMKQLKKEQQKQTKKDYGNERVECECSMWYSRSNKSKHENTKYHKEWVEEGCPYREGGVDPETLSEEERKKLMELKMDEYIECACGQGYARKDKQHHITSSFHRGFCKAIKEKEEQESTSP